MTSLLVTWPGSPAGPWGRYRLAGRTVEVCPPLGEIESFRLPELPGEAARRRSGAPVEGLGNAREAGEGATVYRGPVWLGGAERPAHARRTPGGYRVDVEGIGRIEVAGDGSSARVEVSTGGVEGGALGAEAALGPALVLTLALGGTFCLHASAVAVPGVPGGERRVVAFLGAPGAGKSTLARLLDGARAGWLRVADDVLPVVRSAGRLLACPRFPQLKMPDDAQPGRRVPETVALGALYLLRPPGDGRSEPPGGGVLRRRLTPREGALALVRNSVAARLFDGALLAGHLEGCAALAERPGVTELAYPWRGELVPGLPEAVASGLEAA